ncbi:conserved hypothetical protein [Streptomyces misionensis JCM 4497]
MERTPSEQQGTDPGPGAARARRRARGRPAVRAGRAPGLSARARGADHRGDGGAAGGEPGGLPGGRAPHRPRGTADPDHAAARRARHPGGAGARRAAPGVAVRDEGAAGRGPGDGHPGPPRPGRQRGDGLCRGRRRDRHHRPRRLRRPGPAPYLAHPRPPHLRGAGAGADRGVRPAGPRTARPHPPVDLDLRAVGHQRHRTGPGGGRARTARAGSDPGGLEPLFRVRSARPACGRRIRPR